MGYNTNEAKALVLGMPAGTAQHQLRKSILFKYVRLAGDHFCYKCGAEIETIDEFSIEHKEPWFSSNAPDLFWDLDNIAFSHVRCNRPHVYNGGKTQRMRGPEGTEWCTACRQFVDINLFTKSTIRWNGVNHRCKPCTNEMRRGKGYGKKK